MSFIKFTALSGSRSEGPLAYLLSVDDCNILLDCGWTDKFNVKDLAPLKKVVSKIDAVLFSHADMDHLGAYPYAFAKLGLNCPSYATIPVHNMGNLAVTEAYKSLREEFTLFDQQDIDNAFDRITQLRYSQHIRLAKGVTITAHRAGHSIGGTIWKITKDTDQIVYAVDYNHKKERHLNGTVLHLGHEALSRPSILITDSYNTLASQPGRKQRDALLISSILNTLQTTTSTILIPIETTTRILELAYLLDQHWALNQLPYPLLWYAHTSEQALNYAKSMLEWMGDAIAGEYSIKRDNPFDFKYLKATQSPKDLLRHAASGGRVILTSTLSMDSGYAFEMLHEMGADPNMLVILTDRSGPDTIARTLYNEWLDKTVDNEIVSLDFEMDFNVKHKVPLEGQELEDYLVAIKSEDPEDSDSDSDLEMDEPTPANTTMDGEYLAQTQYDIHVDQDILVPHSKTGFFKQSKSFKMFPVFEKRWRIDDYGEVIDPSLFMNGEYQSAILQQTLFEELPAIPIVPKEDVIPCKYFSNDITVNLKCNIIYIDFEGRVDGNSIRNILPQVAPRKLILVHGSEDATDSLQEYCMDAPNLTNAIFSPRVGETINVSTARNIYQVKLTDSLISSLKTTQLGDYELAYISGIIQFPPKENEDDEPGIPNLDIAPLKSHEPVIVGQVKLSEFRKVLHANNLSTIFYKGKLIVDKRVVVMKNEDDGGVIVEGSTDDVYYRVRRLLYSQMALL